MLHVLCVARCTRISNTSEVNGLNMNWPHLIALYMIWFSEHQPVRNFWRHVDAAWHHLPISELLPRIHRMFLVQLSLLLFWLLITPSRAPPPLPIPLTSHKAFRLPPSCLHLSTQHLCPQVRPSVQTLQQKQRRTVEKQKIKMEWAEEGENDRRWIVGKKQDLKTKVE